MKDALRQRTRQLKELASILPQPAAWRALLSWRPFSITAYQMMRALEQFIDEPLTVIDVGANEGQFTRAAAETYPASKIISFEPLPEIGDQLERNLDDTPNVTIYRHAVGAADGTISFHRYAYSLESSALPRLPDHRTNAPPTSDGGADTRGGETISVPVRRLDSVVEPADIRSPCLLKLDVQGYELEVIRGAEGVLPAVDYMLVEAAFAQSYEKQPLFDEIYSALTDRGYRLLAPIDVLENDQGVITQVDALFQRK